MPEANGSYGARSRLIAEAIAEAFTSEYGGRNPVYDINQPDGPDNEYHLRRPMSERVQGSPAVHFTAGDGCRSFRTPTCEEIAEVVEAALLRASDGKDRSEAPGGEQ